MDIESQLRRLEAQFRAASGILAAAHAHHSALAGDPDVAPSALAEAQRDCRRLEERKRVLVARIEALEDLQSAASL